ncbi:MAG: hypothetical protein CL920_29180 [Deltaproteobacteria bacterium]|nr:hypothetical protein [Deltaproteobacteria bacterium]|tara:strand:- start:10154 stop:10381 length:228 start_codon:yes stop_codon:yes gene_type:complete
MLYLLNFEVVFRKKKDMTLSCLPIFAGFYIGGGVVKGIGAMKLSLPIKKDLTLLHSYQGCSLRLFLFVGLSVILC